MKKLWLCRDKRSLKRYVLYCGKKPPVQDEFGKWTASLNRGHVESFCSREFHRATSFRLEPGEGPVEVEIKIERKG